MKLAFLFPGQGSQKVGMGKDFYQDDRFPKFKKVMDILSDEQKNIAFEGPDESLSRTYNTQPTMLAVSLGIYKELEDRGITPNYAAGLSLGEYTALAAAGVFCEPEEAIELVKYRAIEMEKASGDVDSAMIAILGMDISEVEKLCKECSTTKCFAEVANLNCPGQVVVSGERNAVERVGKTAKENGALRIIPLKVSGPFHTSYMKPAGAAIRNKISHMSIGTAKFEVFSNVTGNIYRENEDLGDMLERQVSGRVLMEASLRRMIAFGVDCFVEIGPGKTLAGFKNKIDRTVQIIGISNVKEFENALDILKGR